MTELRGMTMMSLLHGEGSSSYSRHVLLVIALSGVWEEVRGGNKREGVPGQTTKNAEQQ
jgi:hypothetical protein